MVEGSRSSPSVSPSRVAAVILVALVTRPRRPNGRRKPLPHDRVGRAVRMGVARFSNGHFVFALVATGIGLLYYFGPDADQDWAWITPGAVAATILWLVVSLLFEIYIANFTDYEGSYRCGRRAPSS